LNVHFACPLCEAPSRIELAGASEWQCPNCDHLLTLVPPGNGKAPDACLVCGNRELYKKKDFPHWLGLTILTIACLGSVIPYWLYHQWWTWVILIGSALFDGLLYLWVGDVAVCYRCNAHYRAYPPDAPYAPFELGIGERYRQERQRLEQLQKTNQLKA
jgi:hypothetical protein